MQRHGKQAVEVAQVGDDCVLAAGSASPPSNATYTFNYSRAPFAFTVSRAGKTTDPPLFTTQRSRLVFKVGDMLHHTHPAAAGSY